MANISGGSVVWDIRANSSKFNKNIASAKNSVKGFGGTLKKQDTALNKTAKSLKNLALGYLTFRATAGAIRFIGGLTEKFAIQEQAVARLNASMSNVAGTTGEHIKQLQEQAAALQRVTTFGDEQIISAQAMLGTFQQNKDAIQVLTPRILDMAASLEKATGGTQDLESISLAMGKVIGPGGTAGALKRYGVALSKAQEEQFNTAEGMEKVNLLAEILDKNYKGIAEGSAKTLTGRMANLSNRFGDFQEKMGGVAQFVKVELLSAFINGSGGMEAFGDNSLQVAKQVGEAFLIMGREVITVMKSLVAIGKAVGSFIGSLNNSSMEAFSQSRDASRKIVDDHIENIKKLEIAEEEKTARISALRKKQMEIDSQLAGAGNIDPRLEAFTSAVSEIEKASDSIVDSRGSINDAITGLREIKSISDFMPKSTGSAAKGFKDMGDAASDAAGKTSDELKKQQQELDKAKEKVITFKQKEIEMSQKVRMAYEQEKIRIQALKVEYEKAVASIKRNLEELDRSFNRNEESAKESFLSQLHSASQTAKDTIKSREEMIQEELNKGENADQEKIAKLQALNAKEQAILDRHGSLIAEATRIEEEKKTAIGVENLINRFNREREERAREFEREKSELQSQLAEKEAEYKKSSAQIKQDTVKAIADIRSSYLKMFDDLHRELQKLGEQFVNLLKIGNVVAPGTSMQAESSFANFMKNIPKRAMGGPVMPHRPYMVGERGPEIIVPKSAGTVIPNGGATIIVNVKENADWRYGVDLIKRELGIDGVAAQHGINN